MAEAQKNQNKARRCRESLGFADQLKPPVGHPQVKLISNDLAEIEFELTQAVRKSFMFGEPLLSIWRAGFWPK